MSEARGRHGPRPGWAVAAEQSRAFPRDPGLSEPSNGPGPEATPTVGPETASSTQLAVPGAEPVVVDGDALAAAYPTPRGLAPSPWAGLPSSWQPAWSSGAGGPTLDPVLGRAVSTVFACVDLNANALGSMPVGITENGRPIDPDQYRWTENPEPRLYSDWSEFVVQWAASMYTRGEAFIHATDTDWDTLLPSRFMVLNPDLVTVEFDPDGNRRYQLEGREVFGPDLLHTRYMTVAGWPNGLSPLAASAGNLRGAAAYSAYGANLAEGGGIPWGVLSTDQRLSVRQAQLARQQYRQQRADLSGDPVVLGYGLSLDTLTITPRDMALLDLRIFDEQRIAAALGTPPWLVSLPQPEGMTYANVNGLFGFHWRRLRPVAKRLTSGLSAWCLPRPRRVVLNAGDYVQPDLGERATAYRTMKDGGALLADEWRALEQLPPLTSEQLAKLAPAPAAAPGVGPDAAAPAGPAVANATTGTAVTQ